MTRLVLAAWALLAGCSSSGKATVQDTTAVATTSGGGEIHITTQANSYAPGAQVAFSIHNATARQYAFNPCTRSFEREGHGAVPEPDRMCTMEAWLLEPDGTRDATVSLPPNLEPGRYRFAIDFAAQDSTASKVHAESNWITVTP